MTKEQGSHKELVEDNIDLINIAKTVWNYRRLIVKIVGLFLILGLFIAFLTPKSYTASSTFVPQSETSGKGGNLSGLASLAGINLSGIGSTSEIPPSLYPKIINSVRFKRALLTTPITLEESHTQTTYNEFYEKYYSPGILSLAYKYTFGLPKILLTSMKASHALKNSDTLTTASSLIQLSEKEVAHFNRLESQIHIIPNNKDGTVELSFEMPEALMAAEMAQATETLLQKEVISFKIKNAKEQLKYTKEQFEQKKAEFKKTQQDLAHFRDRNQNISSAMAMNRLRTLEAEYNFAFNLYTEMAKQYEQTKLQVSKDTPVFAVINPVSVPINRSAPNRVLVILVFFGFGIILALAAIFLIQFLKEVKQKWINE